MPLVILDGAGGVNKANVDIDGHLGVNPRPPAFGALGYYRQAAVSGSIAATVAAGATLWSCRWTNSTNLCLVQSVRVSAVVNGTITASVAVQYNLNVLRSYTVADSAGTAVGVPASMQKMRTSMGSSLMGDWRIAAAAALTAGTRTVDTNAIGTVQGVSGTAVSTLFFGSGVPQPIYSRDNNDNHPIILAQNEGLALINVNTGPATGTFVLLVQMEWGEVASF